MPTLRYWTGTSWELLSLGAPAGTAQVAVSADLNNASRLGSDGKIFTPLISPSATVPLRDATVAQIGISLEYARADHQHPFPTPAQIGIAASTTVPLADGNVGVTGTSAAYARADHVHPRPTQSIRQISAAQYTLQAGDTGNVVWNVFPTGDATILLPADTAATIPVGSTVYILADSTFRTLIQPAVAGVGLYWQDKNATGGLIKGGGVGTGFSTWPIGVLTLTQVIKVAANTWYHFTN